MDPGITVVIPTRNRAEMLHDSIPSVLASPLVTRPDRVLVVDDGSTDQTREVVTGYGVRYARVEAGSAAAARNAGLALVGTPYVAFLDDDDVWLPGNMDAQLKALEANPRAAFAYGRFQLTDFRLNPVGGTAPDSSVLPSGSLVDFLYMHNVQLGTVLLRADLIRAIGEFDVSEPFAEDQDLLLRLASRHPAAGVEFVGSLFRQRDPSAKESNHRLASIRHRGVQQRRNKRNGIRPSLKVRALARWKFGGFYAWMLCQDAMLAANDGRRAEASKYLLQALRLSPPHALVRNRLFWQAASRCLTGARPIAARNA